jgi:hypothetical protein
MKCPHIDLAHSFWKSFLKKGDIVIDATCGNGHDSLFLVNLTITENEGLFFGFDIQKKAIENTFKLLQESLSSNQLKRVNLFQRSHEDFSNINANPKLIVYNLGYLPLSDKNIITTKETTLKSLQSALDIIAPQGAIGIICYRRHIGGLDEEQGILEFLKDLNHNTWEICYHNWLNKELSPTLIWMKKLI